MCGIFPDKLGDPDIKQGGENGRAAVPRNAAAARVLSALVQLFQRSATAGVRSRERLLSSFICAL